MIEIRIRKFFKTEDGELTIAPAITLLAKSEVPVAAFPKHVAALDELMAEAAKEVGPIREMTEEEVAVYRQEEDEESGEYVVA